jgi:hypothetical protein
MNPENPLYSVSLGVASLQVDSVGVATALSPVCVGHFKFYLSTSIVSLGLGVRHQVAAIQLCLTQRSPEWRQDLRVADGRVIGEVTRPDQGRLAFFGELEYEVDGLSYTLSTQMRMTQ